MVPQTDFRGFPFEGSQKKVFGRSSRGFKGIFGIIGIIILLVVIVFVSIFFAYPALTPNKIHGDFLDMTIVPQKDGSQKLWILTDGSFSFIQTTKSPGSTSTGRKCFFCKTWTYIYDPVTEKIEKKIKTEMKDILIHVDIFYSKGKVWEVADGYHENEPRIDIYDPETAEKIGDTKSFIARFPILAGGISSLRYDEKDQTISFNTKDGKEQVLYIISEDKIYDNMTEYIKEHKDTDEPVPIRPGKRVDANIDESDRPLKSYERPMSYVVLTPDAASSKRYKLLRVSGPKFRVDASRTSMSNFVYSESTKNSIEGLNIEQLGSRVYLEGIIYYIDNDVAVIIHLDQIGKKSNRFVTCVDIKAGKENWTAGPDELFDKMKIDENKNAFSSLFFTKDNIKVRRSGNLVVVELKGEGLIGFDTQTGKKLWEMSI